MKLSSFVLSLPSPYPSPFQVVLGTPVGLAGEGALRHVTSEHFDVAVVDEAGQALEVAAWMAILRAPR